MLNEIKIFLTRLFDPFELLYLSIAIATLDHTVWAGAFLFEGSMPVSDNIVWKLKGLLIAIAVDLGMLLTSRFLQNSVSKFQTVVLTISFIIAAVTSFYFQMVYILFHTPVFKISEGVDKYWIDMLTPFLQARVILLPLALPVLATAYTVARIFTHKARVAKGNSQAEMMELERATDIDDGLGGERREGAFSEIIKIITSLEPNAVGAGEYSFDNNGNGVVTLNLWENSIHFTKTNRTYKTETREKLLDKALMLKNRYE